jgi:hypothetical protein
LGDESFAADDHGTARVDEDLVAKESDVSHGDERPGIAVPATTDADRSACMNIRTDACAPASHLEIRTNMCEGPDAERFRALHLRTRADLDAILEDESGCDEQ